MTDNWPSAPTYPEQLLQGFREPGKRNTTLYSPEGVGKKNLPNRLIFLKRKAIPFMGKKNKCSCGRWQTICTFCAKSSCPHPAYTHRETGPCCVERGSSYQHIPRGGHQSVPSQAPSLLRSPLCCAGGAGRLAAGKDVPVLAHRTVLGRGQRGCRCSAGSKGKITPAVRSDGLGLGCKE